MSTPSVDEPRIESSAININENSSFVLIKFKELGSVLLDIPVAYNNVTAMQLLAVAGYLETRAKTMLSVEFQSNQIAVPKPSIALPGR